MLANTKRKCFTVKVSHLTIDLHLERFAIYGKQNCSYSIMLPHSTNTCMALESIYCRILNRYYEHAILFTTNIM